MNKFGARERAIGIALAFVCVIGISYSVGNADGYKAGRKSGDVDGWNRAAKVAFEKGYWLGAEDGCIAVYDATGWEYIYINAWNGGGTLPRSFCRDSGDHTNTPNVVIPYESIGTESN